jgi:hypothetical protein
MSYTVGTLLDEANLLRDSLLVTLECVHFEAYVHVNAIMWRVVFKELRGLTNSKVLEISPTHGVKYLVRVPIRPRHHADCRLLSV